MAGREGRGAEDGPDKRGEEGRRGEEHEGGTEGERQGGGGGGGGGVRGEGGGGSGEGGGGRSGEGVGVGGRGLVRGASASQRLIVLLRGINLANRRRVGMADLRELLAGHGYEDVRTHLQSGNVVRHEQPPADRLGRSSSEELERGLGSEVEVIVRTRAELARVVARQPARRGGEGPLALPPSRFFARSRRRSWCASSGRWTSRPSRLP